MIQFPEFPNSRELVIDDKEVFDELFTSNPPEISAYTFTNLYAWRKSYNTFVSQLNGFLIIQHKNPDFTTFLEPIGTGNKSDVIIKILESKEIRNAKFERISRQTVNMLSSYPQIKIEPNRDDFDYVYLAKDLIELSGRHYDGKRNFITRIKSERNWVYEPMTGKTAEECKNFADEWCVEKMCDTSEGLRKERSAVYEMLDNFEILGIVGGLIRIDGIVSAFSLGEPLNPDTIVIHIEKANAKVEGLYQLINNEFCKNEANGYKYVNREQDLGIPGLRKAKESYRPIKMIEVYRLTL